MSNLRFSFGLPIVVCLAGFASGQANLSSKIDSPSVPSASWVRPTFHMAKTDTPPKIDGDLSDPCWKDATKGTGFFRFPTIDPVEQQTESWICAGKKSLYIAFHCFESHPESIKAKETQRNGNLDQDDRVLVLIDSQCSKRNASEFWVNARGTQMQNLEGGSADNQAWQGDWTAVAKPVNDGWIVEIEIPFSLLKYPKGASKFGILLGRKKSSESTFMVWPYVPPEGSSGNITPYMSDFDGIAPPAFAPKPVISPYMLSTSGHGTSTRFGLDVKYPLTTTVTGLLAVKPDFSTVEGAVQDLSFSYTEKFVPDHRPFFAENGNFIDDQKLFYSQRISDVDFGLKVTGRQCQTSLGFLSTASQMGANQYANIANFDQDLGTYGGFGGTYMDSHQMGLGGGQVLQARGSYGWAKGVRKTNFYANITESILDNGTRGKSMYAQVRSNGGEGRWSGNAYVTQTEANFGNPLGLVSETDVKGAGINLFRNDDYSKGKYESKSYFMSANSLTHLDGRFFHDSLVAGFENDLRSGFNYGIDASISKREQFHDQTLAPFVSWNQKSLLSRGKFSTEFGHVQNKTYRFTSISQGFPMNQRMSFNLSLGQVVLGSETNLQTILSGTYRIDPLQSFGGRMVTQDGKTNLYLSYGKRTRKGNDFFILLGDPNSLTSKRAITIKIVRSL